MAIREGEIAVGRYDGIVQIIDMSAFVAEQRTNVREWKTGKLMTPIENEYVPADWNVAG